MRKFDQKKHFFEWPSWFNVNHMGLATGLALKSYASVAKELKLKVRKCWGLIPTFEEVTGEKLLGRVFFAPSPPIQNRVYLKLKAQKYIYNAQHQNSKMRF